jgi:hypothetical protein
MDVSSNLPGIDISEALKHLDLRKKERGDRVKIIYGPHKGREATVCSTSRGTDIVIVKWDDEEVGQAISSCHMRKI